MEKNEPSMGWTTARVPKELKEIIESFIYAHPEFGIGNFTDFTKRALREKYDKLKAELRAEHESMEDLIKSQEELFNSPEFKKEMQEMKELPERVGNLEKKVDLIINTLKGLQKLE